MSQTIQTPEEEVQENAAQEQGTQAQENQEKESWFTRNQTLWEFIKFQILSNISTATRILLSIAGTWLFITNLSLTQPFSFLIFNYSAAGSGGLGGFLTFLIAEVAAQVVNFFVQMKFVFKGNTNYSAAAPRYAVLAVLIVVVNLVLPGYVTAMCLQFGIGAELASTIASVVNTLLAVIVSFPVLKLWIAPAK